MNVKSTIPSPHFRRFASGSSFFVNYTLSKDVDTIPPSRIIDLRRSLPVSAFNNQRYISFAWTAPGNDFVYGKAARYVLECLGGGENLSFDTSLPQIGRAHV